MHKLKIIPIALAFTFVACTVSMAAAPGKAVTRAAATHAKVDEKIKPDADVEALIKPYRDQLQKEMNTVIGQAATDMTRGTPEGLLGDFVSDVIRETANHFQPVDCAITNNGGLRAPVYKGDIKIENMFQLMPFENRIVIARFSGPTFQKLIAEIVSSGGCPVSGLTIVSRNGTIEAYVGKEKVDGHRDYTVATIDYLMDGGGNLHAMWEGKVIKDTGVLLREALIDYVRKHHVINQKIDGRVVIQ